MFELILGLIAGALTTISFVPQVIQVVKTRSTRDISLGMYIVLFIGISCWLIYGILIEALPLIIANTISAILALIILIYKIIFK